ncbi:hypothetical protein DMI69_14390 [Escherichia coli]|nr:hypothetical protein [Escherichia coli]
MLRQISTGTAMGDDYFSLLSAAIALLPMTIVLIMIAMLRFFSVNFMPLASVAFCSNCSWRRFSPIITTINKITARMLPPIITIKPPSQPKKSTV